MAFDEQSKNFLSEFKNKFKNIELVEYFSTCALTGGNVYDAFLRLGRIIIKKKSNDMII